MTNNKLTPTVENLPSIAAPSGLICGPTVAVTVCDFKPGPPVAQPHPPAGPRVMIDDPPPDPEPDPGDFPDPDDEPIIVYPPIPPSGPVGPG